MPIDRVVSAYPAKFFQSLLENVDAGFMKAAKLTEQNIAEPERVGTLGQLRHACTEEAFRGAAQDSGVTALAPHTEPAGGRFSLVSSGGVYLIRSNIQAHCGSPRPSRFRKQWALLNAWLDPVQLSLLETVEDPPSDRLCGMLVVSASGKFGDPTVPAFVGLGIPSADLSAWKFLRPLTEVLALYHDRETELRTPFEAPVEIKDQAVPKLKRRNQDGGEDKQ
jgi:hypothetical protein